MDASTYGRLVERGGYATGGIIHRSGLVLVGEAGPELTPVTAGTVIMDDAEARLRQLFARRRCDPDDGAAGVLAHRR